MFLQVTRKLLPLSFISSMMMVASWLCQMRLRSYISYPLLKMSPVACVCVHMCVCTCVCVWTRHITHPLPPFPAPRYSLDLAFFSTSTLCPNSPVSSSPLINGVRWSKKDSTDDVLYHFLNTLYTEKKTVATHKKNH